MRYSDYTNGQWIYTPLHGQFRTNSYGELTFYRGGTQQMSGDLPFTHEVHNLINRAPYAPPMNSRGDALIGWLICAAILVALLAVAGWKLSR
jgi:hypothetical protein